MSSNEKRKTRRSFAMIGRIFQLILMLTLVFFLSFFITLSIKTPHPVDFIITRYFSEEKTDKLIDDYENEKKSQAKINESKTTSTSANKNVNDSKTVEVKKFDGSTLSGKIDRISSIKQAVNERIKPIKNYVTLNEIPRSMQQAIVAVEDSEFYNHSGFKFSSIARATVVNVKAGKIEEGGSTITQQLVKNLFLSQEQSFTRKIEELILAIKMEDNFSKDKILEMYLNTIYFGSNFYGIYEASEGYFGKEPQDLTIAESAMLAGLPNAPSLYSPYVNFMLAKKRQLIVIEAMQRAKILTDRQAEDARIETITLSRGNN